MISLVCYITISPKENDSEFVNAFAFSPNTSTGISTSTVLQRHATVPVTLSSSFRTRASMSTRLNVAGTDDFPIDLTKSFVLTEEEVAPLVKLNKESGKEKWINAYGILFVISSIFTAPFWWIAMAITDAVCNAFPDLDPNRKFYDKTGKIWSKAFLTMTNSFPGITGDVDRLRESDNDDGSEKQACLYVANHASWLDIPVLCTVLSPVFKFISKAELLSVPCIGKQLTGVSTSYLYLLVTFIFVDCCSFSICIDIDMYRCMQFLFIHTLVHLSNITFTLYLTNLLHE